MILSNSKHVSNIWNQRQKVSDFKYVLTALYLDPLSNPCGMLNKNKKFFTKSIIFLENYWHYPSIYPEQ
jgi:hypothetical protein